MKARRTAVVLPRLPRMAAALGAPRRGWREILTHLRGFVEQGEPQPYFKK
jgi:hypothetical protein